jgi:uncharacterized protein (TIGR04141 family)
VKVFIGDLFEKWSYKIYIGKILDDKQPAKWADKYPIKEEDKKTLVISQPFAIIVLSKEDKNYIITQGKAHFYVNKYAIDGYGLDLLNRDILDKPESGGLILLKKTDVTKNKNSNEVITGKEGCLLSTNFGDVFSMVKGSANKKYRPIITSVSCGSSVQINTKIKFEQIYQALEKLIEIEINSYTDSYPVLININNKQQEDFLFKKLFEDTTKLNFDGESEQVGVQIFFSDDVEYKIFYKKDNFQKINEDDKENLLDLNYSNIREYFKKKNIAWNKENCEKVKIQYFRDGSSITTKNLKSVLFYEFHDEQSNEFYLLKDDKWKKYNRKFSDEMNTSVSKISLATLSEIVQSSEYKENLRTILNQKKIEKEQNKKTNKVYREYVLNTEVLSNQFGYTCIDTKNLTNEDNKNEKIELADLYKNNTIYALKIGKAKDFAFCAEQAILSMKAIKSGQFETQIQKLIGGNGSKDISTVALWLLSSGKTKVSDLSKINSIYFKIQTQRFIKVAQEYGFEYKIYLDNLDL